MSSVVGRGLVTANENDDDAAVPRSENSELMLERHAGQSNQPKVASRSGEEAFAAQASNAVESSSNRDTAAHNATAINELDHAMTRTHLSNRKASVSLHIDTHVDTQPLAAAPSAQTVETPTIFETTVLENSDTQPVWTSQSALGALGPALKTSLSTSSMASLVSQGSAPASALSSPYLSAMTDITPLPSPTTSTDPSKRYSWRISLGKPATPRSRESSMDEAGPTSKQLFPPISVKKRKGYGSLLQDAVEASMVNAAADEDTLSASSENRVRDRSISDYIPEHLQNVKLRHVTFGPGDTATREAQEHQMHREEYLATKRGLTSTAEDKEPQLPTPSTSTSSIGEGDEAESEQIQLEDGSAAEYLEIRCGLHNKRRKFRQIRQLGQGTFSKVMLATREKIPARPTPEIEQHLNPHDLVAVKIVEQGPAGGADEQRIEIGLKREVEMLKSLSHPSIIHLKACEYQESRALLVLTYCPGGDLFEFASWKRDLLTAQLVQRIFAELVGAVRYLHNNWIVHRDIKLENVLVNLSPLALRSLTEPRTYPKSIVTLTDLGLSRRIPEPPESPLLTTRCGSEDYAAPEVLLGERYDGRLTDAWALGVLLYALIEGRLPFDAPPGKPERSRNTHRIARCTWIWCRFGDEDGDWEPGRGGEFEGARPCVENLLKKVRMGRKPLDDIANLEWVRDGIVVPGGLRMRPEDEEDEIF